MSLQPPPIYDPLISLDDSGKPDEDAKAGLSWILFFNQIFNGDAGTAWTPTFTDLTQVGMPTITGRYYRISQSLVYFSVNIIPSTSTTSTAGTTYISNFPLTARGDGICFAVSGLLGSTSGMVDRATNRIYVPAWTTVTVPLTIIGLVEAR